MAVILDILGSFVVRAAIVVIILNLMISLHESLSKNTDRVYLNQSIENAGQIIAADIKLAGYNATTTFAIARRRSMQFSADTGNNGTVQTIRYYTEPSIPTAVDKAILKREVIGTTTQTIEIARDIIDIRFTYFNVSGSVISGTPLVGVKSIYVSLLMVSNMTERTYQGISSDTAKLTVKWERQFFPENL